MALANPYQQYRQQQVNTAPPDKLLLLLYDAAIRFCNQAKAAMENNKTQEAHDAILKAERIIEEFTMTLNMDYEISKSLGALYEYLNRRLFEANVQKNTEAVDEVLGFLIELRETWVQAAVIARTGKVDMTGGGGFEG